MASKREIVVATENYLKSKGYNNSTGKYDRVIMGVKSLLGETLLTYGSPEFERAIQQETERMLKKYVKDEAMEYDPIMCMMVPKKAEDAEINGKEAEWVTIKGHKVAIGEGGKIVAGGVPGTNIGENKAVKSSKKKDEKNEDGKTISQWFKDNLSDLEDSLQDYPPSEMEEEDYKEYLRDAGFTVNKENLEKIKNEYEKSYKKIAKDLDTAMVYDEVMAMMKPVTAKDQKTVDGITNISNHAANFISKCETAIKTATPENAEKIFMELQKERSKTLNSMNDVYNEVSKELTENRNKVMAAFQEVNNKLFKIYNKR